MYNGWYQVAFTRDLSGEIIPTSVGQHRLMLVRNGDEVRAFDAVCPHRGAHLGMGGRIDGDSVVCPFHGRRIGLGTMSDQNYCTPEHPALTIGGSVYVLLGGGCDNGLAPLLHEIDRTHQVIPVFSMPVRVAAEMVIENGFDTSHFKPVHGTLNEPACETRLGEHGELVISGMFVVPMRSWQMLRDINGIARAPYDLYAFSPGLAISSLGGVNPYWIITAATPVAENECVVRLSLAVPLLDDGSPPREELYGYLLQRTREGVEQDVVIWENLCPGARARYEPQDAGVVEFRKFCRRFWADSRSLARKE